MVEEPPKDAKPDDWHRYRLKFHKPQILPDLIESVICNNLLMMMTVCAILKYDRPLEQLNREELEWVIAQPLEVAKFRNDKSNMMTIYYAEYLMPGIIVLQYTDLTLNAKEKVQWIGDAPSADSGPRPPTKQSRRVPKRKRG